MSDNHPQPQLCIRIIVKIFNDTNLSVPPGYSDLVIWEWVVQGQLQGLHTSQVLISILS